MGISALYSRAQHGMDAPQVRVETHLGPGLPGFTIVGLPETAVRESRDRVRSALVNSGFQFPQQRLTVNLAPADLPKSGGRFDLAIALGILVASGQLPPRESNEEFIGELALDGVIRPVRGVLCAALACADAGNNLVVADANAHEASLCRHTQVFAAHDLLQVCAHWRQHERLPLVQAQMSLPPAQGHVHCLSQVRGQLQARRALEVAASGGHSLLLIGPPGSGKSMLASRLPGLLPALSEQQALEVAAVHSLHRHRTQTAFFQPPYRAPHHTASAVALVGGGNVPRPGEISLAHHGVLFLDELPEFERRVLEALREPLETGRVHIARANHNTTFPACFQLVAAMNPCPCGYLGDPNKGCGYQCEKARRYQGRISGPLRDRMDVQIEVQNVSSAQLLTDTPMETSAEVRARVITARARQAARQGKLNCQLDPEELKTILTPHRHWLAPLLERLDISARATHRVVRVARTLADMEGAAEVGAEHLREALAFRIADPVT